MKPNETIRVLLVDDSPAFLEGARNCLADYTGLEIVGTAANGLEALEANRRLQPDLVLMDALMPDLDGLEATRRIKADPNAPWVVIVTFLQESARVAEIEEAGADDVIVKAEFYESLGPILQRVRAARRDET